MSLLLTPYRGRLALAVTAVLAVMLSLAGALSPNREIGEWLYLSPRTVGSHLYRIFPKLQITFRAQLAGRLGPP